jgi:hypothetical protein
MKKILFRLGLSFSIISIQNAYANTASISFQPPSHIGNTIVTDSWINSPLVPNNVVTNLNVSNSNYDTISWNYTPGSINPITATAWINQQIAPSTATNFSNLNGYFTVTLNIQLLYGQKNITQCGPFAIAQTATTIYLFGNNSGVASTYDNNMIATVNCEHKNEVSHIYITGSQNVNGQPGFIISGG